MEACTASINAKVTPEEKELFNEITSDLGLSPSVAIRMFIKKFNETKGFPYEVRKEPRPMTKEEIKSIRELEESIEDGTVRRYKNFDEILSELD